MVDCLWGYAPFECGGGGGALTYRTSYGIEGSDQDGPEAIIVSLASLRGIFSLVGP
jgi:hypothetical protein